jgi:3'-phosphoadenosine 5'-phosphosulfate sulfotransferase (PAPS reductase)/FAD synthetase
MPTRGEYFAPYLHYEHDPYVFKDGQRQRRRRPALYSAVMRWLETYECSVERPLFHWKTTDVLALCRQHGMLNPLYDLGCDRVGCFPCIMVKKSDLRVLAQAHPEQVETIAAAEQTLRSTFFPYSKLPARFGSEPTIRDVVRWATEAEEREVSPPNLPCMSHYLACE